MLLLLLSDFAYTYLLSSKPPGDKIALLKSYSGKKINYVFLGSSRVNNDIIPALIEKETGKSAVNFGVSSARPKDVLTFARLLVANHIQTDTVFVQVDYGFNHLESSRFLGQDAMPFLWKDEVLDHHFEGEPGSFALRHLPFYRYAAYDQKLGIRTALKSLWQKSPSDLEKSKGYMMLKGQRLLTEYDLPGEILGRNPYHEALEKFASEHGIKLVYFISPFMSRVGNLDFVGKLKAKVPGLRDYSNALAADSLFNNQSHLNHEGAKIFTRMLVRDLICKPKAEHDPKN